MPFSIAICGAGPAGLTLARLLQVSGIDISVSIYERDASPKSRERQGGTLDLHPDTGLAALRQAGLFDVASKHLRYDAEEMVIADKNATVLVHMKEQPKWADNKFSRPEIDRESLKDILLESVDNSWIKWGKTLESVEKSTGLLTFRDGSTAGPFDLIVGADGAWSKVRHVLTDVRPQYAGICGFTGSIENPNTDFPHISKQVGRGSYLAFSDKQSLIVQRMGNESLNVNTWHSKEENHAADIKAAYGSDEQKLNQKIVDHYQDWAHEMKEWIEVSTDFQPRNLYELPVGHTWEHKRGYTLIGDAASLMTPFAGEGVNKAMKDCLVLCDALKDALQNGDGDLDKAVQNYETEMFPRAKFWQGETMKNKRLMYGEGGPPKFLAEMAVIVFREVGIDLSRGLWRLLPVRFCGRWITRSVQRVGSWRRTIREWFRR
jgi:2-polyprenyl-6-methoxyphenol hydroxylase-like FAD-dependent oxidoreductase